MALTPRALATLLNGRSPESIAAEPSSTAVILEQYRICVDKVDSTSERRHSTNTFFLALNSAIVALGGYTVVKEGAAVPVGLVWLTAGAGALISFLWLRLIISYRDLASAKFDVIHEIEKLLPLRPYDAEWDQLGRASQSWVYVPFTHIELWVPVGFVMLHICTALVLTATLPPAA